MSVETHLLYAIHGPIVAALLVSLLIRCFRTEKAHDESLYFYIHLEFNSWFVFSFSVGQSLFPAKYYQSFGYQVARYAPGRVQHVHEGSESHPDPGSPAGNTVCHHSLEAGEPAGWWSLRVHNAHTHALPGRHVLQQTHRSSVQSNLTTTWKRRLVQLHCPGDSAVLHLGLKS